MVSPKDSLILGLKKKEQKSTYILEAASGMWGWGTTTGIDYIQETSTLDYAVQLLCLERFSAHMKFSTAGALPCMVLGCPIVTFLQAPQRKTNDNLDPVVVPMVFIFHHIDTLAYAEKFQ